MKESAASVPSLRGAIRASTLIERPRGEGMQVVRKSQSRRCVEGAAPSPIGRGWRDAARVSEVDTYNIGAPGEGRAGWIRAPLIRPFASLRATFSRREKALKFVVLDDRGAMRR
jgi:hypothetical protein